MISQATGGIQEGRFLQITHMGGVSTAQIQTPTQRRRNCNSLPSSNSTRSQRQRLCPTNSDVILLTVIPLVDRLSQFDLHGHNHQAVDGNTFDDTYPSSPSPNSISHFKILVLKSNQRPIQPRSSTQGESLKDMQVFLCLLSTA